ncbi:hypothetical protein [Enteractinococcus helveticum]|uniref:hypothetical protein n=1 Tax=Enteractinococcus helveticum TaxID=1837282 RepID=UPI00123707F1|nr:hypothetical protein [Enteractinococcus helveticum]
MKKIGMFVVGMFLLVGTSCASPDTTAGEGFKGDVPGSAYSRDGMWAAFADWEERTFYITTLGSSNCPLIAQPLTEAAYPQAPITVATQRREDEAGFCTADLQSYTSKIAMPDHLEYSLEVEIRLQGFPDSITLDGDDSETSTDQAPEYDC